MDAINDSSKTGKTIRNATQGKVVRPRLEHCPRLVSGEATTVALDPLDPRTGV